MQLNLTDRMSDEEFVAWAGSIISDKRFKVMGFSLLDLQFLRHHSLMAGVEPPFDRNTKLFMNVVFGPKVKCTSCQQWREA